MTVWTLALAAFSLFNFADSANEFTYEDKNGTRASLSFNSLFTDRISLENENFHVRKSYGNTVEDLNMVKNPNFKFLELRNNEYLVKGQVMGKTLKYPFGTWEYFKKHKELWVQLCTNFGERLPWKAHELAGTRKLDLLHFKQLSLGCLSAGYNFSDDSDYRDVVIDNSFNPSYVNKLYDVHQDYEFSMSRKEQLASMKFLGLEKLNIKHGYRYVHYSL